MPGNFGTFSLADQYGAATRDAVGEAKLGQLAGEVQRRQTLRQSLSNLFMENPNATPGDAAKVMLQQGEGGIAAQLYNAEAALGKLGASGKMETTSTKLQEKRNLYRNMLDVVDDPVRRKRLRSNIGEIDAILKKKGTITGRTEWDAPTKRVRGKLQEQVLSDDLAIEQLGNVRRAIAQNPESVGVPGFLIENVGGLLEQLPVVGEQIGQMINSGDVTEARTGLYMLTGQLAGRITGDPSRYSDQDMKRVMETMKGLNAKSSMQQVMAALGVIENVIRSGREKSKRALQGAGGKKTKNRVVNWEDLP